MTAGAIAGSAIAQTPAGRRSISAPPTAGHSHAVLLLTPFCLDDQIGRAQQDVAEHHAERDENGKTGRKPVEGSTGEAAVRHSRPSDQAAERKALAYRGDEAAEPEGEVPHAAATRQWLAELEGDAAKDQRKKSSRSGKARGGRSHTRSGRRRKSAPPNTTSPGLARRGPSLRGRSASQSAFVYL